MPWFKTAAEPSITAQRNPFRQAGHCCPDQHLQSCASSSIPQPASKPPSSHHYDNSQYHARHRTAGHLASHEPCHGSKLQLKPLSQAQRCPDINPQSCTSSSDPQPTSQPPCSHHFHNSQYHAQHRAASHLVSHEPCPGPTLQLRSAAKNNVRRQQQ
jgi:hypothetical protein